MTKQNFLNTFLIIIIGTLVVVASVSASTTIGLNIETGGSLLFNGSTSGTVTFQPASAAGTYTLTLPTDDGTADQVLTTDGSGALSWTTPAGGVAWGGITGTLSDQTDLQDALDTKVDGTAGVKVYRALLTQSGTDAPVATVLENTLGGTVVWLRDGVGYYYGTLTGAFPEGKTLVISSANADNYFAFAFRDGSSDFVNLFTRYMSIGEPAFNLSDEVPVNLQILVYP
ncbi:hypothetical protein A3A03_02290 [Candidatus Nomurabacteria bacterium RIFCSPLOWO2_01_FULL_40_18]|uniref:Uncharacterized protein n=1 Tax=Candidatus Nomurabacteria bacterium RIFCSPLOWO2_01_FULL_40_18 TaxID=1801773 RepID=A0A1F6XHS7_9BACT|nr:MAG: hypothetical protein A3A03_02290 [Candidatus Nomurabacteria bacterium RIFCSPLOWO2_01_FULL_40_18]